MEYDVFTKKNFSRVNVVLVGQVGCYSTTLAELYIERWNCMFFAEFCEVSRILRFLPSSM